MVVIGGSDGLGFGVLSSGYNPSASVVTNQPVAQYNLNPVPITYLGKSSPQASQSSVLAPTHDEGLALIQTMSSDTASEAQKADAAAKYSQWQTNMSNYLKEGGYQKQKMQADIISAHPTSVWDGSSFRVFDNGEWKTLPASYQETYQGDPYLDATSKAFMEVGYADAIAQQQELQAHQDSLLDRVKSALSGSSEPKSSCLELYPPDGPTPPDNENGDYSIMSDMPPAPGSDATGLSGLLTPKNVLVVIIVVCVLYLVLSVFGES